MAWRGEVESVRVMRYVVWNVMRYRFLVSLLVLEVLAGSYVSERSSRAHDAARSGSGDVIIFQFLEESNYLLWCNWITVAVHFRIFEDGIGYYLSCMGSNILNERVKSFYPTGCDMIQNSTSASIKRIYYSKWSVFSMDCLIFFWKYLTLLCMLLYRTAFVDAFSTIRKDMILVDLDALIIRNPLSILRDDHLPVAWNHTEFDIISSADHGHSQRDFKWGEKWVQDIFPYTIRLCTGFIYFRFSQHVENLLFVVSEYLKGKFVHYFQFAF